METKTIEGAMQAAADEHDVRLCKHCHHRPSRGEGCYCGCHDAADRIGVVTAERDRLREALKECVTVLNRRPKPGLRPDGWEEAMKQAKAALDGTGTGP